LTALWIRSRIVFSKKKLNRKIPKKFFIPVHHTLYVVEGLVNLLCDHVLSLLIDQLRFEEMNNHILGPYNKQAVLQKQQKNLHKNFFFNSINRPQQSSRIWANGK
jgi:hypothetical protein